MKFKLKKDIVIKAGTVLDCVDGESRQYCEGNYSTLISLTDNTSGELVYGIDTGFDKEESEWFEEVEESEWFEEVKE